MTGFLTRTSGRGRLDWTDWFTYLYLALGLFVMFGPVAWLVLSSFKTESAITEFPPSLLPMGTKQVAVPGEDKPKPVYRVTLADGSTRELAELRRIGLRVLMNEHVIVRHEGAEMVVAGVTDFGAHHFDPAQRSDPQAALAGAPDGIGPRVLLAHQPRSAEAAERAGFDLQLSGHTHGGQFWPWNLFVPLQQPFTAGLNRLRRLWVYTSRGTGYWGPPKRFGAPSEITRLRLVLA